MTRNGRSRGVVELVCAVLFVLVLAQGACATEELLAWDDGGCDGPFEASCSPSALRVLFLAPGWATQIDAVRVFVVDGTDSAGAFSMHLFRPCGAPPPNHEWFPVGPSIYAPVCADSSWCEVVLSTPVCMDSTEFPGGLFSIGLVWQDAPYPRLGMDTDEPIDEMTYVLCDDDEVACVNGDLMLRVRVSDGNNAGELGSWTRVKALFR